MNRRSIKIHTLITFFSFIIVGLEFGSYYFFNKLYPAYLFAILLNLILCHFFLEASLSYFSCFLHTCISCVLTAALLFFIYFYENGILLIYNKQLPLILLFNWLTPFIYSIIRNFMDRGPRFVGFRSSFWKMSLIFAVFYIFYFVRHFFLMPSVFPALVSAVDNPFLPFMMTAAYIEDSIYISLDIMPLLLFILKAVLLFMPLGFYVSIALKEASRIFLFLLTLLLPLLSQAMPLIRHSAFCMDTYLYCVIGFLLGSAAYQILNLLSNHCIQTDFLAERSRYSFFNFYY